MSTYMAKANEINRKWYIIDAEGKPLGRVASQVARILRGKHRPTYTPHVDTGDHVIVINADKVVLTGKKLDQKLYRRHTLHPGGLKEIKYRDLLATKPERAMMLAVKGMLPHNSLGRKALKKLRVYKGTEHNHQAQKPEVWTQEI
ncbi:MAG: ribosomal protein [Clostridia bacterium]|uniref:50S ribosomal protein L13 n=1 Tax=Petroclostridium xylanilyticum TaxID=1792311 RepID=UPI000B98D417|nr:50S ribosomal protein L13 [Petroclostridium xylanilyticum]MBZ4647516.1 ribosomal protein [Clostridia bacterium]